RSGRGLGYCSGGGEVHRKGWVMVGLFGRKVPSTFSFLFKIRLQPRGLQPGESNIMGLYCFIKCFGVILNIKKEAINDEMDSIMGNNTWVLTDLPPGCRPLGCKRILKRKLKVDGTIEKFKARLLIQGFKQKYRIEYFDTYASLARISTIRLLIAMASIHNLIIHQMDVKIAFLNGKLEEEVYVNQPLGFIMPGNENKLMPKKGLAVSQLEYSRVIGCLMYAMTCTRPDIAFVVISMQAGSATLKTIRLQVAGYLLGGGVISWASKKQTFITGSTMESKFVALAITDKEAEWLKNLLLEIRLWVKPMAPIFIRCDSVATLAKAYSHMYNGKSRHLGVRHSMIRELITNGVVSIEFVVTTKPS
nr:zinc finger, CCHC-type [Tanacetum cinerariifolium]